MTVDTKKVTRRRSLKFATLDDVLADAQRCMADGYQPVGNWTSGQIFSHLARGMNMSIDGGPLRPPWYIRLMGRLMKKQFIRGPMPPGFQLPEKAAEHLVAPNSVNAEQALDELRKAVARLKTTTERAPSPFLGRLTREESDRLHITHCELHLSFLVPPS